MIGSSFERGEVHADDMVHMGEANDQLADMAGGYEMRYNGRCPSLHRHAGVVDQDHMVDVGQAIDDLGGQARRRLGCMAKPFTIEKEIIYGVLLPDRPKGAAHS